MNNVVIKSVKKEDGPNILKYFESLGVDTKEFEGRCYEKDGDEYIYYGVIKGNFNNYSLQDVKREGAKIIRLPSEVTLTREKFKQMHNAACCTWKGKLIEMFPEFATKEEARVTKEQYDSMYAASTRGQRKLLDSIFGDQPFKKKVYLMCTKDLDDAFKQGNMYELVTTKSDGYILINEKGREHTVTVGLWGDYFYKVD